ncbi:Glycoside hydrolase, 38 vacuolar alpha mannosidase [Cryptotrichosporon argae]
MRISLLQSATAPDPEQDQTINAFGFAIMRQGRQRGVDLGFAASFTGGGSQRLVLDTIKRTEDEEEGETKRHSSHVREHRRPYAGSLPAVALAGFNILEEPITDESDVVWQPSGNGAKVHLDFRGFEVKTLEVTLR